MAGRSAITRNEEEVTLVGGSLVAIRSLGDEQLHAGRECTLLWINCYCSIGVDRGDRGDGDGGGYRRSCIRCRVVILED